MITVELLADHSDAAPMLAAWFKQEWPVYFADRATAEIELDFRLRQNRDELPIALVAFDDGVLCGTVTLAPESIATHRDLSPWLCGLLVEPQSRGRGIGTALVEWGAAEARRLGFREVFAATGAARELFARAGWRELERTEHDGESLSVMRLPLAKSPLPAGEGRVRGSAVRS